ncbi:MAG: hypothetical protein AVDCRST_MAG95-3083 [uncultured Adhaeribacter sp.]|uniref:Uncharacterized protein n=1 Tax=uncultured Adhaeribacter sp. TaxID=448109 RepID=A0A6J4JDM6_9BACT|nr:MAG: hypothetical protein AVDCRST_MAG95-3083 [uncultured Adhaeribacter sp.]
MLLLQNIPVGSEWEKTTVPGQRVYFGFVLMKHTHCQLCGKLTGVYSGLSLRIN